MADSFQVVSARLLHTSVSIDGGVSSGTSQVLAILVGNMFTFRVLVALGEAEVNNVNGVLGLLCSADQKVIWFDVAVDDPLLMHLLDSFDHLVRD